MKRYTLAKMKLKVKSQIDHTPWLGHTPGLLVGPERQAHEVLVLEAGGPVHGGVAGAEAVGQPLDLHRHHDEVVQGHLPLAGAVLGQQVLDKGGSKPAGGRKIM